MLLATSQYSDETVEIHIHDAIGKRSDGSGIDQKDVEKILKENKHAKDIHVRINSGGGFAWQGVGIYNILKDDPRPVKVTIDSLAGSAASIIAMAGDVVEMYPTSALMIHEPYSSVSRGRKKDFETAIQQFEALKQSCIIAYTEKTGLTAEEVSKMMVDETFIDAKTAISLGFANTIKSGQKISPVQLDVSGFGSVPEVLSLIQPSVEDLPPEEEKSMTGENFSLDTIKQFKATFGAEDAMSYIESETPFEEALAQHVVKQGEKLKQVGEEYADLEATLGEVKAELKEARAEFAALDVAGEASGVSVGETVDDDEQPKCMADLVSFK